MKKLSFGGGVKIQILTYFFENVIKIAAVASKAYIEGRVGGQRGFSGNVNGHFFSG